MSTFEDTAAWYSTYIARCNQRDFDELAEFVADDVVVNGVALGLVGYTAGLRAVVAAFADYTWTVDHLLVDGDWIAVHLIDTGTHTGTWRGLAATGRAVRTHEFAHYRRERHLVREVWVTADDLAILDQLQGAAEDD